VNVSDFENSLAEIYKDFKILKKKRF